jgi:large subunit ribosomal protein L19
MTNNLFSKKLIQTVEKKYKHSRSIQSENLEAEVGDLIELSYKILEGDKERIQIYRGLVISKQNRNLGRSITIRRNVQGIGVEQIFLLNSPKILSIIKKQSSKVRRAKLYFIRSLSERQTKLKLRKS